MRIALDATPLLAPRTGIGVFVDGLLEALAALDQGDDVRGYALTWRGHDRLGPSLPASVRPIGHPLPARLLRQAWRRADHPIAETLIGRADVIHGTNYVVPPARHAAQVVTVHDLTFVHFPEMCEPVTLELPGLVRRAVDRGAVVHTPSRFVADEVRDWLRLGPDRVFAVPYGVTPVSAATDTASPGDTRGGRSTDLGRYVLALGTVEPRKDLPSLVAAFGLIAGDQPDLALVIAGPDGWGANALAAAIARSPWADRIHRLGWVSDADRTSLLAGAAVLAFPSRYEGFGYPPLEALSAGVPVVATTAGSLPEVLGPVARLVAPADATALAGALSDTLAGVATGAADPAPGRDWVARYTWQRCATELRRHYARLTAAR